MTAADVLADLRRQGFVLMAVEQRLRVEPKARLTPELRSLLTTHKTELVRLVAANQGDRAPMIEPVQDEGTTSPCADPRPDLTLDHRVWQELLNAAFVRDGNDPWGVFASLHGLRCCGAALEPAKVGVQLVHGELSDEEYVSLRKQWLLPQRTLFANLLKGVGTRQKTKGRQEGV